MNTAERAACFNRPSRDRPRQLNVPQSSQRLRRELGRIGLTLTMLIAQVQVCVQERAPLRLLRNRVCEQALGAFPGRTGSVFVIEKERIKVWPGHESKPQIMWLNTKIEYVNFYVVHFLSSQSIWFLITNEKLDVTCFKGLRRTERSFGKSAATRAEMLQRTASHRFNEMSPLDFFPPTLLSLLSCCSFKENKICLGYRLSTRLRGSTCWCLFILIYAPSVRSLSTSETLSCVFLEAPPILMDITAFHNYFQAQI